MKHVLIALILLSTFTNLFSDVCSEIAKNPNKFIKKYSIKEGFEKFDIDNDGVLNDINCSWSGSANIGRCYYKSNNNQNINFGGDLDDEGRIWGDIFFITYKKIHYFLNSKNRNEPLFLSDSNGKVCEFSTKIIEKLIPNSNIDNSIDVCNAIQTKDLSKISYINFSDKPTGKVNQEFQTSFDTPIGLAKFDYNNDGIDEVLLNIIYSMPKQYYYNYFKEIDKDKMKDKQSKSLLEVRNLMGYDGEKNKFFIFDNKVYFEHVKNNFMDSSQNFRKIYFMNNDKLNQVCDYKQELKIKVD